MANAYVNKPPEVRFWPRVNKQGDNGCWLWTAGCDAHGYGSFAAKSLGKPNAKAHHISWYFTFGSWPKALCHRCDNPKCVNPDHMWICTQKENMQDARKKGRTKYINHQSKQTHCLRGHPFSGDNLRINKNGHRECRACVKIRNLNKKQLK